MVESKKIIAVVGPTASGKTALGVAIAQRLGNAEVVSCDSVQIYSGIEIATAKPSVEEMCGVPHHLIGYVNPRVNYTAADWARDAAQKLTEIEAEGKTAVIVGGTGFYLRTLRQPLFESPPTDPEIRARLLTLKDEKGSEALHAMLCEIDPEAAKKISARDFIRTTRALEVFFQTGLRISEQQPKRVAPSELSGRISLVVLDPSREDLYARINIRTQKHFEDGLIDEVRQLLQQGVPENSNALGAHGYRRVCEHLRGERSLEETISKTQQDVRNYAKRQRTWFKSEHPSEWFHGFGESQEIQGEVFRNLEI